VQERHNSNAVITGNVGKSLIVLVVVKQIVLADDSWLQSEVSSLVIFCFGESIDALNVESRATLVVGKVAQRITILAINNLQAHYVVVSFHLDLIDAVGDTLFLVFGTLFLKLYLAFYNVILAE
jgi:hypothetical protein